MSHKKHIRIRLKSWSWQTSTQNKHLQKAKIKSWLLWDLKDTSQPDSDSFLLRCRIPLCLLMDVRSPAWSPSQCDGSHVAVCSCRRWPSARPSSTTVRGGQRQRRSSHDPPACPWEPHRSSPSPLQRTAGMQPKLHNQPFIQCTVSHRCPRLTVFQEPEQHLRSLFQFKELYADKCIILLHRLLKGCYIYCMDTCIGCNVNHGWSFVCLYSNSFEFSTSAQKLNRVMQMFLY